MTNKEKMIINKLQGFKVETLVEMWEETEKRELSSEVARVRGWIMDVLETQNPEAFDNWLDSCTTNNPREFFL